jgi:molecular chaperone HscC
MDSDIVIGIDLGTTNSAVAFLGPAGPEIVPNAVGGRLTPSVVGIDGSGAAVVGAAARELQVVHPDRCASLFKRYMGTDHTLPLAGRQYAPEELSGLVLRSLKADAEAAFRRPVTRAVITVPAYFNDRQRKATIAAGRIAGFTVERILNEPTAAAIAYGFHEAGEDKKALVFDLGGGTFDVSVIELFEGALEVKASSGESALGGEDLTRAIAARVLEARGVAFERAEARTPKLVARLIQQCERAKCALSREPWVTVRVPGDDGEFTAASAEVRVDREQLERWVEPILARVELPIRRALGDAGLTRAQLDEVILVGGATRMPVVVRRVTELLGREPRRRLNPDEVVALGAAVQAGLVGRAAAVEDLVVTDVAPFTLGVEISKQFGTERRDGYFDAVIDRNTTVPVSRVKRYSTVHPNQTSIVVQVYQGESRRAAENLRLGEFEVKGIPPGPPGEGVDIRFSYDLNGVLEVEATVVSTRKTVTHVIAKHAKGMTEDQIRAAVRAMARLKTHPRDEEANRLVLLRAERLYQELPAELRQSLTMLLDGYETALEGRDKAMIDRYRGELELFLSAHDPSDDAPGGAA